MSDTKFLCKRCGFTSDYKQSLIRHLEKKKTCEALYQDLPIDELLKEYCQTKLKTHRCELCNKSFSHSSGLSRHKMTCVESNAVTVLKEKLASVERQLTTLQEQQIDHSSNISINNTYNIVMLNNFGSEDVSHVLQDKQFLDK